MKDEDRIPSLEPNVALSRSLVAADILALLSKDSNDDPTELESIIIEIDTNSVLPPAQCHSLVLMALEKLAAEKSWQGQIKIRRAKSEMTDRYVFLDVSHSVIRKFVGIFGSDRDRPKNERLLEMTVESPIARRENEKAPSFAQLISMIFRIWRDHPATPLIVDSISTVKVDATQNVFAASDGEGIVWAVLDTGVDGSHPHFQKHKNLLLPDGLSHLDLAGEGDVAFYRPTPPANFDLVGHGTHVAGIIAGQWEAGDGKLKGPKVAKFHRYERAGASGKKDYVTDWDKPVRGMAPKCKILAIRVLNDSEGGKLSDAIVGLQYVRQQNLNRNTPKIHGINISLSYPFDPEWYGAGMSPLCKEIDRLVDMGVCVVVAAGNTGYGQVLGSKGTNTLAATGTICDPGNAKSAITVGSTHRSRPREAGVSYFSSRGPTSDGRMKPDLIAPGERIVSCKAANDPTLTGATADYCEMSGTSMAAPHVSGAIACLLSARPEFIGRPLEVKQRVLATATDLGLAQTHQGKGLLDVLELITSSYEGGSL